MRTQLITVVAALGLVLAAAGPGIVTADTTDDTLTVDVTQTDDGSVSVTVMKNESTLQNASVAVNATSGTYDGDGNYTTDEDGQVSLPAPEENVTVEVNATADGQTATTNATLTGVDLSVAVTQHDDGTATVDVVRNGTGVDWASVTVNATSGTYDGDGDYTTEEDGTVELPAPEENVTVEVTAGADGQTARTTASLTVVNATENESFGQRMSRFVHALRQNHTSGIGQYVSSFAVENNPGNAPDHAGPPTGETESGGPPWADDDDENDDRRGPPAHAGPPEDETDEADDEDGESDDEEATDGDAEHEADEDEEDETDEEETDEEETEENGNSGGGPPEHAGPPGHAGGS